MNLSNVNIYKKVVCVAVFCLGGTSLGLVLAPLTAHAETIVGGSLVGDTVWNLAGSPYLLTSNVTVPSYVSLSVLPGVVIGVASTSDTGYPSDNPCICVTGGYLNLAGQAGKRIKLSNLSGVFVKEGITGAGSTTIVYTDIFGGSYVGFNKSIGRIASSTITGADVGLSARGANITITGSKISQNNIGISVSSTNIFQFRKDQSNEYGIGGYGNALAQASSVFPESVVPSLIIQGSDLSGNTMSSLFNGAEFRVEAENNWWGELSGPSDSGPNYVRGNVGYVPWLDHEPDLSDIPETSYPCCSNILFIPGLEASRLYRSERGFFGLASSTNMLWEPNRNADVRKLYLNPDGSSIDSDVYSGGPINKALGIVDVYSKFMNSLDGLAKNGTVGEWRAFGYDWRRPISDVVINSQKKATTTESLLEIVQSMASTSKTGKVTLIAHSNGGLVAKYLVKVLSDVGKSGIIDSVISVGTPYLGTPEAIGGLLHGDGQSMLGGLILSSATARGLGENMSSAYSLLPSRDFFFNILGPTIVFASTTTSGINPGSYPKNISSYTDQTEFIVDTKSSRMAPNFSDTIMPIKGNLNLVSAADAIHGVLDSFVWPASIARWAVVGWNTLTTKGLEYLTKPDCTYQWNVAICIGNKLVHQATTTMMGDGTVVAPSAAYQAGQIVAVDLGRQSELENTTINHVNILEASSTARAVMSIVSNPTTSNSTVLNEISKLPGVALGEPDYSKDATFMRVSTHSPVELHIYDSQGRHTGLIPKPASLAQNDFIEGAYETKIPGSRFEIQGGGVDRDTYISIPNGAGQKYSVSINGLDYGFFTFNIEQFKNGSSLEKVEYTMEPSSPLMIATTTIKSNFTNGVFVPIASTTPSVYVDVDGNSSPDYEAKPGGTGLPGNATTTENANKLAMIQMAEVMEKTLDAVTKGDPRRKSILDHSKRFREFVKKGRFAKPNKSNKNEEKLEHLGHMKLKNISAVQKEKIIKTCTKAIENLMRQD